MAYIFVRTLTMIFNVVETAVLVYCILSWIAPQSRIYDIMAFLLEPLVRPFRPLGQWIMEKTGVPLDFSLWIFMIAMHIAQTLIYRVYYSVL